MPVTKGIIGNRVVTALRNTGCSRVVVKRQLVDDEQLTGKQRLMVLVDNTARKAPFAKIRIDTPNLTGEVDALCLQDVIYDLIIGNVPDARAPDKSNENWSIEQQILNHQRRIQQKWPQIVLILKRYKQLKWKTRNY